MTLQVQLIPVTPLQQNCALLWDSGSREAAVIDPGGDVPRILAAISAAGAQVRNIYLTHGHLDHAGGATELAEKLGVQITGPDIRDKFLLDNLVEHARQFGLEVKNCAPDAWLAEGEDIRIGGADFTVRHCPGHTPGHVVFVSESLKFGIFGDVLFKNSIGRTDFPYGDTAALLGAIKTKLMVLPDDLGFICGHGPASSIGAERLSNPFLEQKFLRRFFPNSGCLS